VLAAYCPDGRRQFAAFDAVDPEGGHVVLEADEHRLLPLEQVPDDGHGLGQGAFGPVPAVAPRGQLHPDDGQLVAPWRIADQGLEQRSCLKRYATGGDPRLRWRRRWVPLLHRFTYPREVSPYQRAPGRFTSWSMFLAQAPTTSQRPLPPRFQP
jgi:hypothetical protein